MEELLNANFNVRVTEKVAKAFRKKPLAKRQEILNVIRNVLELHVFNGQGPDPTP